MFDFGACRVNLKCRRVQGFVQPKKRMQAGDKSSRVSINSKLNIVCHRRLQKLNPLLTKKYVGKVNGFHVNKIFHIVPNILLKVFQLYYLRNFLFYHGTEPV